MPRLIDVGSFLLGAIRDPITKDASSARIAGLACVISGIVYTFTAQPVNPYIVTALIGGGAVPFLTRTRGDDQMLPYEPPPGVQDTDEGR